jgi:L-amino acid N-acyltransferase
MLIRDAIEADLPEILDIFNHAVLHTTAIWADSVVDLANRRAWMADRVGRGYAVLVAIDQTRGRVAGYASFGDWRPFDGFRATVENSVYVQADYHRRGVGRALMLPLMDRAVAAGKHVMIAGIESGNTGSIALHTALGFEQSAFMPQVGQKFGRWLDLVFLQRVLTPDRTQPSA